MVTDTEAELAAEAQKAKMLSQLVKAADQANYTSIMLVSCSQAAAVGYPSVARCRLQAPHTADKKIVVLPQDQRV